MAKKINTHLYEVHTNLDLEGYEDMGGDGEPTGIKLTLRGYCITSRK